MSTAPIVKVRCHYCSRFQLAGDVHPLGTGGALICNHCLEWHEAATRYLRENVPPCGCQQCGVTIQAIALQQPDVPSGAPIHDNRLWLVPKDGIYQVLCTKCREAYEQKRADLFGETQYGRERNIGR